MNFPQSVRPPLYTQATARRRTASQTLTMGVGFGPWGAPVEWRGARAGATRRSFDFYYCLVLAPKSAGPKFWCPGKTGSIDRYNFPAGSVSSVDSSPVRGSAEIRRGSAAIVLGFYLFSQHLKAHSGARFLNKRTTPSFSARATCQNYVWASATFWLSKKLGFFAAPSRQSALESKRSFTIWRPRKTMVQFVF